MTDRMTDQYWRNKWTDRKKSLEFFVYLAGLEPSLVWNLGYISQYLIADSHFYD